MGRARQRRRNKEDTKVLGCLVSVVVFLGFAGCNVIFGDDEDKPRVVRSQTPTATATEEKPDKAAKVACANATATQILDYADRPKRSAAYLKTAMRAAGRSKVGELREIAAKSPTSADWQLRSWCSVNLPGIDDDTVDKHLPAFRKEHKEIREAEAKRGSVGNGSGSRDGNRGGRSSWRR